MGDENKGQENKTAAPRPRGPQQLAKDQTQYLQFLGRVYMGEDGGDKKLEFDGGFIKVLTGDVIEVSWRKGRQLFADFPHEWRESSEAAWEQSEEKRRKLALEQQARADAQHAKSAERERREKVRLASRAAVDDDELGE